MQDLFLVGSLLSKKPFIDDIIVCFSNCILWIYVKIQDYKKINSHVWSPIPVISALSRKFNASLSYVVSSRLAWATE